MSHSKNVLKIPNKSRIDTQKTEDDECTGKIITENFINLKNHIVIEYFNFRRIKL